MVIDGVLGRIRAASISKQTCNSESLAKKIGEEPKNSYNCNLCKDTTWILDNTGRVVERCKCYEVMKVREQWEASGLKTDDLDKTFKTYEPWNFLTKNMKGATTNYYLRFKDIEKTKHNSILFCGQPGAGKTHLSIALANNFIKKDGKKVVYMPYRSVITTLKQNILDKEYYKKLVSKYKMAEILLIDDLFKGKVNETDINIMFEIINHRYINKLPIIVSTEYLVEEMLSFDEAIGSRIYEMSKGFIVEVRGKENNYRLRG
ncbi:MAG: ATP-binding protein [Clostridium celatum]|nr:ATP-binding protein [Clostridium celatum]